MCSSHKSLTNIPEMGRLRGYMCACMYEISFFTGGRKPEERPVARRSSFRAVKPVMPYEVGPEDESIMNLEASPVPMVPPPVVPPVLIPDEDRRTRRRGSQLWVLFTYCLEPFAVSLFKGTFYSLNLNKSISFSSFARVYCCRISSSFSERNYLWKYLQYRYIWNFERAFSKWLVCVLRMAYS